MIRLAHAALEKMAASPKVYIAAINGHALGRWGWKWRWPAICASPPPANTL